jgi:hypothetical protein
VLIFDESIQHKPYSTVNGLVAWHYDHTEGCSVKGINFISALWADEQRSVPLRLQMVEKELLWDEKKGGRCGKWSAVKMSFSGKWWGGSPAADR